MPSPEKNLQLLENSLETRFKTHKKLNKHRKLLSSLSALKQHTDQLCLQYVAVARYVGMLQAGQPVDQDLH